MKSSNQPADLSLLAEWAYLYTVPLIITEATRKRRIKKGANHFNHARKLLNHRSRYVTTPNNDTLYSDAWLDLSKGPVTITIPATDERYFSLAFMDMYTNNFAILGTRTTGGQGGAYTIVGPDQAIPIGIGNVVRAPTPRVWALARILVEGEDDLPAACSLQDGLFVHDDVSQEDVAPGEPTLRSADWREYLAGADRLLGRERPPLTDGRVLDLIAPLGIGPDHTFNAEIFSEEQGTAIATGINNAKRYLTETQGLLGRTVQGWSYPPSCLGLFGQNYLTRAAISVGALGALPPEEAMYMRAEGGQSLGLFEGGKNYVLHFDVQQIPPLNSFWSLSLYEATDDGMFFFADTPLRRYAIGDRSPDLAFNEDGSLDLWIGLDNPGEGREGNWLPSTKESFSLWFRGYLPKPSLISGGYRLPKVMECRL